MLISKYLFGIRKGYFGFRKGLFGTHKGLFEKHNVESIIFERINTKSLFLSTIPQTHHQALLQTHPRV